MRVKVIVDVFEPTLPAALQACLAPRPDNAFERWLREHRQEVLAISDNHGCGCCVDIYVIEFRAPVDVPAEIGGPDEADDTPLFSGEERNIILDRCLRTA
jgi:hypothetical protein